MAGDNLAMMQRMRSSPNLCWGDMAWEDEQASRAAETPQQTAARLARDAEAERKNQKEFVGFLVSKKEDKWTKGGQMKFRVPRPCKYASLFAERICAGCNAAVPLGQTHCGAKKGYTVCGQELAGCWNHEQTKTCIYIHPDEPQWKDACSGQLCYDRQASCFHLKGQEPAQVNRFAAAVRSERLVSPLAPRAQAVRQGHGHERYAADDGWEHTGKRSRR
jgi:hypothetical protein